MRNEANALGGDSRYGAGKRTALAKTGSCAGRQRHCDRGVTFISWQFGVRPGGAIVRKSEKGQGRRAMAEHKFKMGQLVDFHPRKGPGLPLFAPEGPYKVSKRLPSAAAEFQYVIRSTNGSRDCVARESELRGT